MVQCLGFHRPIAGGTGLIPAGGTKILQASSVAGKTTFFKKKSFKRRMSCVMFVKRLEGTALNLPYFNFIS